VEISNPLRFPNPRQTISSSTIASHHFAVQIKMFVPVILHSSLNFLTAASNIVRPSLRAHTIKLLSLYSPTFPDRGRYQWASPAACGNRHGLSYSQ
jgi:hypothetical protein